MIKIKSQVNRKLLKNFASQSFPDICIITTTNKYNLTLAYLIIDSEYFQKLPSDTTQINLSHLPQKALVQILRALYGDQLVVYSVKQLQEMYMVINQLKIDEYKHAIVQEILSNKDLTQNLQILEFCVKNNLIVDQIKKIHINNNLRALQSNKNFLQLNKISLQTLIPLLLEYYQQVQAQGTLIINSIMQNYFNRNNIRPLDFFQKHDDVDILLNIWQQCHHILHIQRKTQGIKTHSFIHTALEQKQIQSQKKIQMLNKQRPKTQLQLQKLKQKDAKIAQLQAEYQQQNRMIQKLQKQLMSMIAQNGKFQSSKRLPTTPILAIDDEDQISLIQEKRNSDSRSDRRQTIPLKNIKSQHLPQTSQKTQMKIPGGYIKISHKPNFIDV